MLIELVGAFLRWGITAAISLMLSQQIISAEQGDRFLSAWTSPETIAYVAGLLLTLAWSCWAKYRSRVKMVTGLAMPPGSSESDVESYMRYSVTPSVTLPKHEAPYLTHMLK